jgi:hypothetical protein
MTSKFGDKYDHISDIIKFIGKLERLETQKIDYRPLDKDNLKDFEDN